MTKSDITVSIIIPVYNMQPFIRSAIESVLSQTFQKFEIIIVNDGSTDATFKEIEKYLGDPRIKYLYQERKGPSAARNTGIRHSKGEFIAFLDGDDYWASSKLEKQVKILENWPDVSVVYCKFHRVNTQGLLLSDSPQPLPPPDNLYKALLFGNIIYGSCSAVVVRAAALEDVGLFDERLYIGEDLELWLRLAYKYVFYCIDEFLVNLRVHSRSAQANREYYVSGQLVYVRTLKSRIAPEYSHLWSEIAFSSYAGIYTAYLNEGKKLQAAQLLFRVLKQLGFKYFWRIIEIPATRCIKSLEYSLVKLKKWIWNIIRSAIYSLKMTRRSYWYFRDKKKLAAWENAGQRSPLPLEVKQRIILNLQEKHGLKTFVESGTSVGEMVEAVRWDFQEVYSLENDTDSYISKIRRFVGARNVFFLHGNNVALMRNLLPKLPPPCFFWLNAHFETREVDIEDVVTTLADELHAISQHEFKSQDVILIDGADGFDEQSIPSLSWVEDWASQHGFDTCEVEHGIIRIYNKR